LEFVIVKSQQSIDNLREGFNKRNIFLMEFSITGGRVYPFSITFFVEKNPFFQECIKRCSKASNSSRNVRTSIFGVWGVC
jgi:hypothetical protein